MVRLSSCVPRQQLQLPSVVQALCAAAVRPPTQAASSLASFLVVAVVHAALPMAEDVLILAGQAQHGFLLIFAFHVLCIECMCRGELG